MANLQFISNVTHHGVTFRGAQLVTDESGRQRLIEGMIVDPSTDASTPSLSSIVADLKDRGLVRETNDQATHSATVVGLDQYAVAVNAPSGTGQVPAAQLASQREAVQTTTPVPQASVQPQAPAAPVKQPTPEEAATAANSAN